MKNKLFWPIVLVAVVVIIESVLLLSARKQSVVKEATVVNTVTAPVVVEQKALDFTWLNEAGKVTLMMKADRAIAVDAIDLYVGYQGGEVTTVTNLGDLPKPSFQKISKEKSLVVLNYLISAPEGLKLAAGQEIKVIQLTGKETQLSIDPKTQVVENGTAKVLPFNNQNLVINSAL
jgi:hypothetical protein